MRFVRYGISRFNMSTSEINAPALRKPLWLKPAIIVAALLVFVRFVLPVLFPSMSLVGGLGALIGALLILLWWLFFSRAPWLERIGVLVLMVIAIILTLRVVHPSIAGGMMGLMLPVYATPMLTVALVAGLVIGRRLPAGLRRASVVVAILLACGFFTLLRTDGISAAGSQITWRWTPTAEERLLARGDDLPNAPTAAPAPASAPATPDMAKEPTAAKPAGERSAGATSPAVPAAPSPVVMTRAEWPGFRGPDRDSVIPGVRIETDWSANPPAKLWSRPIGPGWSSFAVRGDLLYTQEQRGNDEIVACYKVSTGAPVWRHRDPVRFWESNGGAGPRGTPTLDNDRVYTLGATGLLNVLDAGTGAVVWSRNAAADTKTKTPGWGFSGSPLVVGDVVIAATSGKLVGV